ncbi:MAG: crossover junction endodeoxyribonuclease RuvC, partial [Candidatus Paceibacterota bacterium]
QIKMAMTGYGKAKKKQVQKMVKEHLNLEEIPKPNDAADALGAALCCKREMNNSQEGS